MFFPRTGSTSVFVEQIIEAPAISLTEQIVEVLVIQMQGKTQQGANTHVQHVVDTVEVEKPKITELTVQRKKPFIQEKINQVLELTVQRKKPITQEKMNQVTKPIEFPQAQFLDKAGDMLVGMQRHVPMAQTVRKTVEVPPLPFINKVVDTTLCGTEADLHGPDYSEDHRDSTVTV